MRRGQWRFLTFVIFCAFQCGSVAKASPQGLTSESDLHRVEVRYTVKQRPFSRSIACLQRKPAFYKQKANGYKLRLLATALVKLKAGSSGNKGKLRRLRALMRAAKAACAEESAPANDLCPYDPDKIAPGQCGCGAANSDSDGDDVADCNDTQAGPGGSGDDGGTPDENGAGESPGTADSDGDGVLDSSDCAPDSESQWRNVAFRDADQDGVRDSAVTESVMCFGSTPPLGFTLAMNGPDNCLTIENSDQSDSDADGIGDACDIPGENDIPEVNYDPEADLVSACPSLRKELEERLFAVDEPTPAQMISGDRVEVHGKCQATLDVGPGDVTVDLRVGNSRADFRTVPCVSGRFSASIAIPEALQVNGERVILRVLNVVNDNGLNPQKFISMVYRSTPAIPIAIDSESHFLATLESEPGAHMELARDLDFSGVPPHEFPPFFYGRIDGKGFALKNLRVKRNFIYFDGELKNITLINMSSETAAMLGRLCRGARFSQIDVDSVSFSRASSAVLCHELSDLLSGTSR